ncbi:MAG: DUF3786 domain-containing protein [Clostridiales Family XIII bacterium]|jgi:hypothetical protein|nr:DUF3786 domain-containing protein [Clostridiales Family XIII bacterium]
MAMKRDSTTQPEYGFGRITDKPLEHYSRVFASLDPLDIAERTRVPYDAERREFTITLMGVRYAVGWPGAEIGIDDPYARILMLRYLEEGRYIEPTGRYVAYHELPWGDVYVSNFRGRVIRRFLSEFGRDLDALKKIIEGASGLGAEPEEKCDLGYRFDFMNGLPMKILVWEGDDEFPASAQMLYDKAVAFAYTAEDIAVAGDILISRLKDMRENAMM